MDYAKLVLQYAALGAVAAVILFREQTINLLKSLATPTPTQHISSDSERPQRKRPRPQRKQSPNAAVSDSGGAISSHDEPEKPSDDVRFAREFALAQKGTDLNRKSDKKSKKSRTKKQGQTEESPAHSQSLGNHKQTEPAVTSDVPKLPAVAEESSEARDSGAAGMDTDYTSRVAGTLNIIPEQTLAPVPRESEWTSVPTKSQKVQKKVERAEETKKQRQRQAQKEQFREMKEEADKKQRALMEKQRREARIARGEPAKNGEAYLPASTPSKNVWIQSAQSTDAAELQAGMLDTVDEPQSVSMEPVIADGEQAANGEGNLPPFLTANVSPIIESKELLDDLLSHTESTCEVVYRSAIPTQSETDLSRALSQQMNI